MSLPTAPLTRAGPEVAGAPTILTIFTPAQLRASTFLPGIYQTINAAFGAAPMKRPGNLPRLAAVEGFLEHLREDPLTFTIVLHRPDNHKDTASSSTPTTATSNLEVMATASARLYTGPPRPGEPISPFERLDEARADALEWELKLMAVDPALQRQGLAGMLMGVVEEEIQKDFAAQRAAGTANGRRRLRMLLSTLKEEQEAFYARRGYVLDVARPRGEGTDWHVALMSKELVVEG